MTCSDLCRFRSHIKWVAGVAKLPCFCWRQCFYWIQCRQCWSFCALGCGKRVACCVCWSPAEWPYSSKSSFYHIYWSSCSAKIKVTSIVAGRLLRRGRDISDSIARRIFGCVLGENHSIAIHKRHPRVEWLHWTCTSKLKTVNIHKWQTYLCCRRLLPTTTNTALPPLFSLSQSTLVMFAFWLSVTSQRTVSSLSSSVASLQKTIEIVTQNLFLTKKSVLQPIKCFA